MRFNFNSFLILIYFLYFIVSFFVSFFCLFSFLVSRFPKFPKIRDKVPDKAMGIISPTPLPIAGVLVVGSRRMFARTWGAVARVEVGWERRRGARLGGTALCRFSRSSCFGFGLVLLTEGLLPGSRGLSSLVGPRGRWRGAGARPAGLLSVVGSGKVVWAPAGWETLGLPCGRRGRLMAATRSKRPSTQRGSQYPASVQESPYLGKRRRRVLPPSRWASQRHRNEGRRIPEP